jgi:hypothetical protein
MTYVVGAILLIWTAKGWVKSVQSIAKRQKPFTPTEKFLNYPLMFAWLAFATVFSIGVIVNN